jgi:glutamate-5-semialdehyde dehydrogenase
MPIQQDPRFSNDPTKSIAPSAKYHDTLENCPFPFPTMVTSSALTTLAAKTRLAARHLATTTADIRDRALQSIGDALDNASAEILAANQADRIAATDLSPALQARLKLDKDKLQGAIQGVRDVAKLPDPIGIAQIHRELDAGLELKRLTCPLGVLGVIFEARPDAVMQISSLAIKSGNGLILKGGKEAERSCTVLVQAIRQGLSNADCDPDLVQLLTTREETMSLLKLDQYVDLIIPRGSNSFVQFVQANTRIPVLGHADGICHLYIDRDADIETAVKIAVDSKTHYPAACNAIETLLVHQSIAKKILPALTAAMPGVELRGDEATRQILPPIALATEADWATEYSDLILAVRIVADIEGAIAHITQYGSRHTEAIATENATTAQTFMDQVDAAGVYHNCSTRFADGFRYGFGAEVGISTQKMPPRGPVGLEGLVTYKYQLIGDGHIAASYGPGGKQYTHRDLP